MAMFSTLLIAAIALTSPEDGTVYDLHSPCVKEFLANSDKRGEKPERPALTADEIATRDRMNAKYDAWVAGGRKKEEKCKKWEDRFNFYMHNPWSDALMKRAAEEEKTYRPFSWKSDAVCDSYVIEFAEDESFSNPVVERSKGTSISPGYLKLGTKYFWRVKGGEEVSDIRSFTTTDIPPRIICSPSTNMRDMGGGKNADGVRVRQGLLFRGQASACKASADELKALYVEKLGIRSELDLRGRDEFLNRCKTWGESDLETIGIRHVFHPIIPYHVHYPPNLPEFREIFSFLANKDNYPVYFHCAVGSDRTGTIAFLLDGIIGRENQYFYDNYELPSFNPNLPRYRYCRKGSELFDTFGGEGVQMREKVVPYLLGIGVKQEEIDAIRDIMLEK